jgi:FKBP-type peptidyl-prolyl cis-trans isomerase SlyD
MEEGIKADSVVRIRYAMKIFLRDGTVRERPAEEIEFIFGVEKQVPSLEEALEGARAGDTLSVTVGPKEVYGDYDPSLIREIPKKGLIRQRLKEDQYYRQIKGGTLICFRVIEVRPETVVADFNKPMAGITLKIELEVLGIRPASRAEIDAAMESQLKRSIGCG